MGGDSSKEQHSGLREALHEARSAVEATTPVESELRQAADHLAAALRRFHDDQRWWVSAGQLPDEEALLRLAGLPWDAYLTEAGYEPPPPAAEYASEFSFSLIHLVQASRGVRPASVRRQVRIMADQLQTAVDDSRAPARLVRLRASVRREIPVASRAAIVAAGIGAADLLASALLANQLAEIGLSADLADLARAAVVAATAVMLNRALPGSDQSKTRDKNSFRKSANRLMQSLPETEFRRALRKLGSLEERDDLLNAGGMAVLDQTRRWAATSAALAFTSCYADDIEESEDVEEIAELLDHLTELALVLSHPTPDLVDARMAIQQSKRAAQVVRGLGYGLQHTRRHSITP